MNWRDDAEMPHPACCSVVPVIHSGIFDTTQVVAALELLRTNGSFAAPAFMRPEGIVIYHHATKQYFKKTLEKDEKSKGATEEA